MVQHDWISLDRSVLPFAALIDVPDDDVDIVRMALHLSRDGAWKVALFDMFTTPLAETPLDFLDPSWKRIIVRIAALVRPDRAISALFAVGAVDAAIDEGQWHAPALAHALTSKRWSAMTPEQRERCLAILAQSPRAAMRTGNCIGYTSRFLPTLQPYPGMLLTWLASIPESLVPIPLDGRDVLLRIAADNPWIAVETARLAGMDDHLWRSARRTPSALDALVEIVGPHGWQAWRNACPNEAKIVSREALESPTQTARLAGFIGGSDKMEQRCQNHVASYAAYLHHACRHSSKRNPSQSPAMDGKAWASPYLAASAVVCDHVDRATVQAALRTPWDGNMALDTIGKRTSLLPDDWTDLIAHFCAQSPASIALAPQIALQRPDVLEHVKTPDDFLLAIQSVERLVRNYGIDIPAPTRRTFADHAVRLADPESAIATARLVGHDPRLWTLVIRSRQPDYVEAYMHAISPTWAHITEAHRREIIDGVGAVPDALPVLVSISGYDRRHLSILERHPFIVGRYIAALGPNAWRALPRSVQRLLTGLCMDDAFACLDACIATGHVRRFIRAVCRYPSTAAEYMRRVPWTDIPMPDQSALLSAVAEDPEIFVQAARWCGAPLSIMDIAQISRTSLRQFLQNVARNPWVQTMSDHDRRRLRESITVLYEDRPWANDLHHVLDLRVEAPASANDTRTNHENNATSMAQRRPLHTQRTL